MKFQVTTSENKIALSESDLFDMLTSKIDTAEPKPEFEVLNNLIYKSLEQNSVISALIRQKLMMNIFYIVFSVGYYYRLFLEKNQVEILKEENELTNKNNKSTNGN